MKQQIAKLKEEQAASRPVSEQSVLDLKEKVSIRKAENQLLKRKIQGCKTELNSIAERRLKLRAIFE